MRPTSLTEIAAADPTLTALRALWQQYQAGAISAEQYRTAFDDLNNHVGQPCQECGIRVAVVTRDGCDMCGECYLEER